MPSPWLQVPLGTKLVTNLRESVLSNGLARLENSFVNEAGGHSMTPPLRLLHDFGSDDDLYLQDWRGDLILAAESGKVWRMGRNRAVQDLTGIPLSGGKRAIFAKTELGLALAAGERILDLFGETTRVLSADAPLSTHVAYLDGYLIAIERDSGRFYHSRPGRYQTWDPLDVFTAEGTPDNLTCAIVTPYRELILGGLDSVEQFEAFPAGDRPFFRRWATGEGVLAPYTLCHGDNASWCVNGEAEWVRFSAQTSQPASGDVGISLETVTDWTGAWAKRLHMRGQKFLLLQIPRARNVYGTAGLSMLYDYRTGRWASLFGFDEKSGLPVHWPVSDVHVMREWGEIIVAGGGKVYRMVADDEIGPAFPPDSPGTDMLVRMLGRTGHVDDWGECRVDNCRMRLRRGFLGHGADARYNTIRLRVNRDRAGFGPPIERSLGAHGETDPIVEFGLQGSAHTFQFEYETFQAGCEVVSMEVQITELGH